MGMYLDTDEQLSSFRLSGKPRDFEHFEKLLRH